MPKPNPFSFLQKPICFFDLETTGVDIRQDHIVEIAVEKVYPTGISEVKSMLVKPPVPIPPAATEIHGISDAMVKEMPSFAQISKALLTYIEGCDIAGFNSNKFDVPFLENSFRRVGLIWDWRQSNFIDIRNIFVQREERTLSAGVKFYLGKEHEEAHSAGGDVNATKQILLAQFERYSDLVKDIKELAKYSNYGNEWVDIGGKFKKNEAGEIVFAFGQHVDMLAVDKKSYLDWMINKGDFTEDTKAVAMKLRMGAIR